MINLSLVPPGTDPGDDLPTEPQPPAPPTPELSLFDKLRAYRVRIAELRGMERHWQASFLRDELLSEIEHYLDPIGMERRGMLQRIQGEAAVALALDVSDECGF